MEAINQMLEIVSGVLLSLIGNVVFYAFIGAIIGIVIGVFFVRKAKRNGWMERSNKFWTFFAKASYVMFPLALIITGIVQGGIWGAHSTAINVIDNSTRPLIEYAEAYIPQLQSFVDNYVLPEGSSAREIVEIHNKVSGAKESGLIEEQFNIFVLGAFLEMLPRGAYDLADPIMCLKKVNLLELDASAFNVFPSLMKGITAIYLAPIYWTCLIPFMVYFLALLVECILYHFFFKALLTPQKAYVPMR